MTEIRSLEDIERAHILQTIKDVNDNKTEASRVLGITVKTLYNKLAKYGDNPIFERLLRKGDLVIEEKIVEKVRYINSKIDINDISNMVYEKAEMKEGIKELVKCLNEFTGPCDRHQDHDHPTCAFCVDYRTKDELMEKWK